MVHGRGSQVGPVDSTAGKLCAVPGTNSVKPALLAGASSQRSTVAFPTMSYPISQKAVHTCPKDMTSQESPTQRGEKGDTASRFPQVVGLHTDVDGEKLPSAWQ